MSGGFVAMRLRGEFVSSTHGAVRTGNFAPLSGLRVSGFSSGVVAAPAQRPTVQVETGPIEPAATASTTVFAPPAPSPTEIASAQLAEMEAQLIRRDQARQAEHELRLADLEREREKLSAATARAGTLAGDLVRARSAMIEEFKGVAGSLLQAGARRLAGEALSASPELLAVRAGELAVLLGDGAVRVRVNPADHAALAAIADPSMTIVPDDNVGAGCIVESSHGSVDGSLDTAEIGLNSETEAWRKSA